MGIISMPSGDGEFDKVTFTPAFAAGTATFDSLGGYYFRWGNFMVGAAKAAVTGAGSTTLTFTIPESLTIDGDWILDTSATSIADVLGNGKWFDAGSAYRGLNPIWNSTTTLAFFFDGGSSLVGSGLANLDKLSFRFMIPIAEWA